PATGIAVTAGAPFATDTREDHRVEGVVTAAGTASGTGFAHIAYCGGVAFTWSAQLASSAAIPGDDGSSTARIDDGGIGGTGNQYFLNDAFGPVANTVFTYANRTGRVYVGDWDGDGVDTLAYRIGSTFYPRHPTRTARADVCDWTSAGLATLAYGIGRTFYLRHPHGGGGAHAVFTYARPGDRVYVGDWDGDGRDTFAVRPGSTYHFKNSLS